MKGVYVGHIYKDPVFICKNVTGNLVMTPEEEFCNTSLYTLVNGDESAHIKPIKNPIGTPDAPGALHYLYKPVVYVIAPFTSGAPSSKMYTQRVQWLLGSLFYYLYPPGSTTLLAGPMTIQYTRKPQHVAQSNDSPSGKAIMQATLLDHYKKYDNDTLRVGQFRLWMGGKQVVNWDFEYQGDEPAAYKGT
ncbi:hypothetical protein BDW62DRAFT_172981 [Aspergillus aurantiobrunneus]